MKYSGAAIEGLAILAGMKKEAKLLRDQHNAGHDMTAWINHGLKNKGSPMPVLPCDTRTIQWQSPNGKVRGSFRPNGKLTCHGSPLSENPEAWSTSDPVQSARLLVGFNVGDRPTWTVNDLVRLVRDTRTAQGRSPDSTFLIQKGIYTSVRTGQVVEEDGAQVIILNLEGATSAAFRREVTELAEVIAKAFEQELVIVEFQEGGISKETVGVTP